MNQRTEEADKVKSRNKKLKNILKTKKYKPMKGLEQEEQD